MQYEVLYHDLSTEENLTSDKYVLVGSGLFYFKQVSHNKKVVFHSQE